MVAAEPRKFPRSRRPPRGGTELEQGDRRGRRRNYAGSTGRPKPLAMARWRVDYDPGEPRAPVDPTGAFETAPTDRRGVPAQAPTAAGDHHRRQTPRDDRGGRLSLLVTPDQRCLVHFSRYLPVASNCGEQCTRGALVRGRPSRDKAVVSVPRGLGPQLPANARTKGLKHTPHLNRPGSSGLGSEWNGTSLGKAVSNWRGTEPRAPGAGDVTVDQFQVATRPGERPSQGPRRRISSALYSRCRLGQGVVEAVAAGTDRGDRSGVGEPSAVADGRYWLPLSECVQHLQWAGGAKAISRLQAGRCAATGRPETHEKRLGIDDQGQVTKPDGWLHRPSPTQLVVWREKSVDQVAGRAAGASGGCTPGLPRTGAGHPSSPTGAHRSRAQRSFAGSGERPCGHHRTRTCSEWTRAISAFDLEEHALARGPALEAW